MFKRPWKAPSLKHAVATLEDGIIVLSGPALAISGIIAGVDLVTGGNVLKSISWLGLVWAITLLLTLDFQVLALGVRAHRVYSSGKPTGQKAVEIILVVLIAAAISFVSIQMQSIIARVNAEAGLSIDQAAAQLGINTIALIWERSTLVLVLIFMSGWLREHPEEQAQIPAGPPAPVSHPAISEEAVQLILARLATLNQLEQALTAPPQQAQTGQVTRRPNTYRQYYSTVHHHLIPSLGHIRLQKLTTEMVQAFFAQKQKDRLSAKTLANIHSVLNSALENAVVWGLVGRNVAKPVVLPSIQRYEAQTLTVEQAKRLLEAARGSRLEALLLLALTTGMRRGELLALRWSDVDLERRVLHVRRTMNFIGGLGYVEGEPKTRAGWRDLVLPDVAVEALKQHRVYQGEARVKAGVRWQEQGIVFSNMYGGFFSPAQVGKVFKGLLKKAGLPDVRLHDLRHSVATILRASGVDLKVIQGLLGHSSIAITADIYAHVLPEERGEAARRMDGFFKRS